MWKYAHRADWSLDMNIVVLAGGNSTERDVSLVSGKAVYEALNVSQMELNAMGENGRLLMENKYSVTRIGEQMKSLYEWVLGTNNKPKFVYE